MKIRSKSREYVLKKKTLRKTFFDVFGHKSGGKYRFGHEFDSVLTGELTFKSLITSVLYRKC